LEKYQEHQMGTSSGLWQVGDETALQKIIENFGD
jgi:hypothetical protein